MKIEFQKVRWKNLLSTGNTFTEIDLCSYPTTLISGSNGSGKSTFMDAMCFGLYNKGFRNVKKGELVNTINRKLLVEVEFRIGTNLYMIRRGIDPNLFEIYKNGVAFDQAAETRDQQEMLEKTILRRSFKTFCQIDILGSANYTPFMQLGSPERKKFVEDMFDVHVFSDMNDLLKAKVSVNKSTLENKSLRINLVSEKIEMYKENIENNKKKNITDLETKQKRIDELSNENKDLVSQIKKLEAQIQELEKQIEKKSQLEIARARVSKDISNDKKRIKDIEDLILFYEENPKCPKCEQDINHKFKHDVIEEKNKEIETIKETIAANKKKEMVATKKLEEYDIVANKIYDSKEQQSTLKTQFLSNKNMIENFKEDVEELQQQIKNADKPDNVLVKLDDEIKQLKKEENELKKESDLFGTASELLKDSVIKAKVINKYIPILNNFINKYLEQMGFYCLFSLDETFKVKVKINHRDDYPYESFSEGEKIRIDLSILFAWREICKLRNSSATNLLILDEVMDSSLDATGMDEFLKIVTDLAKNNNIFVISHKSQISDKFSNNIRFVKEKNFSRIIT